MPLLGARDHGHQLAGPSEFLAASVQVTELEAWLHEVRVFQHQPLQALLRVLVGAAMPAVLVELGFLNNPREESRLVDAEYQDQLVGSLVRAVQRYVAATGPQAATAVSSPSEPRP